MRHFFCFFLCKFSTLDCNLSAGHTLDEILDSNPLPVLVQFSEDQEIPSEGRNREGKPFQFLITHVYEEIFIQGNFITDGKSSFLQV